MRSSRPVSDAIGPSRQKFLPAPEIADAVSPLSRPQTVWRAVPAARAVAA